MTIALSRMGLFLSLVCGALACHQAGSSAAGADSTAFNKDTLAADIKMLASDSFQGRRPFTPGETRTIDYLVNAYSRLGLEPGNGNNFTQDVPLVEISPSEPPALEVHGRGHSLHWRNFTDFVCWTEKPDSVDVVQNSDIVFAGFGIVAPEYNWND